MDKKVHILNPQSNKPFFISAEHASSFIPSKYNFLGLNSRLLEQIPNFYDRGSEAIFNHLAEAIGCVAVKSAYSRLLINVNQSLSGPNLIQKTFFGKRIPGNQVNPLEKSKRIKEYYKPYHDAMQEYTSKLKQHQTCFYICLHSFNTFYGAKKRDMDIGVLYKYSKDKAFNHFILRELRKRGYKAAINRPYSAHKTAGYCMNKYGKHPSFRCVEFEFNNRLLRTNSQVKKVGREISDIVLAYAEEKNG